MSLQLPEILRTPLEEVVLQIKMMHLAAFGPKKRVDKRPVAAASAKATPTATAAASKPAPAPAVSTVFAGILTPAALMKSVTGTSPDVPSDSTSDDENQFSALKRDVLRIPKRHGDGQPSDSVSRQCLNCVN